MHIYCINQSHIASSQRRWYIWGLVRSRAIYAVSPENRAMLCIIICLLLYILGTLCRLYHKFARLTMGHSDVILCLMFISGTLSQAIMMYIVTALIHCLRLCSLNAYPLVLLRVRTSLRTSIQRRGMWIIWTDNSVQWHIGKMSYFSEEVVYDDYRLRLK